MFRKFLKVADKCPACAEELHHHRADDFPAYLDIVIVGHILVPIVLAVETEIAPPMWLSMTMWPLIALVMSLGLLQPIKGAVVAIQWYLGMHGFEDAKKARTPAVVTLTPCYAPDSKPSVFGSVPSRSPPRKGRAPSGAGWVSWVARLLPQPHCARRRPLEAKRARGNLAARGSPWPRRRRGAPRPAGRSGGGSRPAAPASEDACRIRRAARPRHCICA